MRSRFVLGSAEHQLYLSRGQKAYTLHMEGAEPVDVSLENTVHGRSTLTFNGVMEPISVAISGDEIHVHLAGRSYVVRYQDPVRSLAGAGAGEADDVAKAPMPGMLVAVLVTPGAEVAAGEGLAVIESMKLETTIRAPRAGVVEEVHVQAGQSFDRDQALVTLAKTS